MMRIISLFFVLTLVGCGKDYDPDLNRPHVNTDLAIYVNRFVQVAESVGRPVSLGRIQVDFVDSMEGRVIGKCYAGSIAPRIEINRSYWENPTVTNSDRESLVFHELGHCILGRGHDQRFIPGYLLELSIMYPVHLPRSYYENNWQYYMKELFGIPVYFNLSAVSQFPTEYYETPGLVPSASSIAETIYCKPGNCDGIVTEASNTSPEEYEKVYTTSEDELHEGFSCAESQ